MNAPNLSQNRRFTGNTPSSQPKQITVEDKIKFLEELGRKDLAEIFKEWKPRTSARRRKGAPLDQRVTITVTDVEKIRLDNEIKEIKALGDKQTMSQFIRSRAVSSVDINGWRDIAKKALEEIEETYKTQIELRKELVNLAVLNEETDDDEEINFLQKKEVEIQEKLRKITSQNEKRTQRLSGRMTKVESETIKWRAQRLCLSASDYLRMMIFNLMPDSTADSHMSYDAKRRFYISILDVAENGWGEVPSIYNCTQCENYTEQLSVAQERIRQLETFLTKQ